MIIKLCDNWTPPKRLLFLAFPLQDATEQEVTRSSNGARQALYAAGIQRRPIMTVRPFLAPEARQPYPSRAKRCTPAREQNFSEHRCTEQNSRPARNSRACRSSAARSSQSTQPLMSSTPVRPANEPVPSRLTRPPWSWPAGWPSGMAGQKKSDAQPRHRILLSSPRARLTGSQAPVAHCPAISAGRQAG